MGADELDVRVHDEALGVALAVGLDVAQVADVAGLVGWGSVSLVEGVDWPGQRLSRQPTPAAGISQ